MTYKALGLHYFHSLSEHCFAGLLVLITLYNSMFQSKHSLYVLSNPGTKIDLLEPKACCNYIFDLLYISDLFFPEGLHSGNQTAICNITLPVCISFPNSLGNKYVQQIAFGNINKDCHSGLHLQY